MWTDWPASWLEGRPKTRQKRLMQLCSHAIHAQVQAPSTNELQRDIARPEKDASAETIPEANLLFVDISKRREGRGLRPRLVLRPEPGPGVAGLGIWDLGHLSKSRPNLVTANSGPSRLFWFPSSGPSSFAGLGQVSAITATLEIKSVATSREHKRDAMCLFSLFGVRKGMQSRHHCLRG